jgi:hypothetical protein
MLIAVPVWGEWYHQVFRDYAVKSHRAAIAALGAPVRYLVHTDDPDRIRATLGQVPIEFRPVDTTEHYDAFGAAHRDAMAFARNDEPIIFLSADSIISCEAIIAAAKRFAAGYRLVMCSGTRVLADPTMPIGATAAQLNAWAMEHMHPIIAETVWPAISRIPAVLHFRHAGGVVARSFHLHPLAMKNDRSLVFKGTVDGELPSCFREEDIHVVVDPDELAGVSITPPSRRFGTADGLRLDHIRNWAARRATPRHWWFLRHRIVLTGDGAQSEEEGRIMSEILRDSPARSAL